VTDRASGERSIVPIDEAERRIRELAAAAVRI
jgi:hypothetical protein